MEINVVNKLDWDSNFWNLDIYSVENIIHQNIVDFIEKNQDKTYIIQSLVDINDRDKIKKLELLDFHFIETKMTFFKVPLSGNYSSGIQEITLEDLVNYKNDFDDLYLKNSRFLEFNKNKVNEFYKTWIKKSIEKKLDDHCLGFYDESILKGFITYKIRGKKLIIGLLGVFTKYQNKSIAKYLLESIEHIAFESNCDSVIVSTQGTNLAAINTYIKSNFRLNKIENWYYYNSKENFND